MRPRKSFSTIERVVVAFCVVCALGIALEINVARERHERAVAVADAAQADAEAAHARARDAHHHRTKARPRKGTFARARSDLRSDFSGRLVQLDRFEGTLTIGLKADDNFTNGMIRSGMKLDAGDALRDVYRSAGYQPREAIVQFHMQLVDKATGEESDSVVAVYALHRARAAEINWANADVIDWDSYRTMLHPAVR